jgi:transposase, IS5 family
VLAPSRIRRTVADLGRAMQRQGSFSQAEYASKKKQTRRDKFLAEMEQVVPWAGLVARLRPFYPKGERGRPPVGLERMLRIYFLQQWYGLADEALEDAVYDSQALRAFAGIDLAVATVPDATTVLNFRHWLEKHELTKVLFDEVGAMLEERGLLMRQGTIVDATIIAAPPSTKNNSKARDPEMHQTKKGNQWHFGMKAHIGVDVASGVVHTVVGTAANEADINQMAAVLHGREEAVFADAGYTGAAKRPELEDCDVAWNIAVKRSIIKALPERLRHWAEAVERALSQVRAWVEHPFHIVKNLFRYKKLRYRGLAKNTAQLHTLFALANLVIVKKTLLVQSRA